jgi:hypothetical protein
MAVVSGRPEIQTRLQTDRDGDRSPLVVTLAAFHFTKAKLAPKLPELPHRRFPWQFTFMYAASDPAELVGRRQFCV